MDVIALVESAQCVGGETNLLENDGNGTGLPVVARYGQGHPLALFIHPENDELAGPRLSGDEGGFHFHQCDGGVQLLLPYNFIHVLIRPFQNFSFSPDKMPVRFHYIPFRSICQIFISCFVYFSWFFPFL